MRCLGENAVFQLAQRRPGVDAEFFGQPGAGPAQRGERVALPPGLVQRQCEQPPRLLPQRVLGGQLVQVRDHLRRAA